MGLYIDSAYFPQLASGARFGGILLWRAWDANQHLAWPGISLTA